MCWEGKVNEVFNGKKTPEALQTSSIRHERSRSAWHLWRVSSITLRCHSLQRRLTRKMNAKRVWTQAALVGILASFEAKDLFETKGADGEVWYCDGNYLQTRAYYGITCLTGGVDDCGWWKCWKSKSVQDDTLRKCQKSLFVEQKQMSHFVSFLLSWWAALQVRHMFRIHAIGQE